LVIGENDPQHVFLAAVLRHLDHIRKLGGNVRHVAIGTDLDGNFGKEQSPRVLDTIADLQQLPALLERHGYGQDDVAAVLHGNWLRFLREAGGGAREAGKRWA
jgi:membrane dipeptidase